MAWNLSWPAVSHTCARMNWLGSPNFQSGRCTLTASTCEGEKHYKEQAFEPRHTSCCVTCDELGLKCWRTALVKLITTGRNGEQVGLSHRLRADDDHLVEELVLGGGRAAALGRRRGRGLHCRRMRRSQLSVALGSGGGGGNANASLLRVG